MHQTLSTIGNGHEWHEWWDEPETLHVQLIGHGHQLVLLVALKWNGRCVKTYDCVFYRQGIFWCRSLLLKSTCLRGRTEMAQNGIHSHIFPLKSLTFYQPRARCSPSGADSVVADTERFRVVPGHERSHLAFPADSHRTSCPADPEAAVLSVTQNIRCLRHCLVWLLTVSPDGRLWVSPTSDENLITLKIWT
jgi:hypothetical protein